MSDNLSTVDRPALSINEAYKPKRRVVAQIIDERGTTETCSILIAIISSVFEARREFEKAIWAHQEAHQ